MLYKSDDVNFLHLNLYKLMILKSLILKYFVVLKTFCTTPFPGTQIIILNVFSNMCILYNEDKL